MAGWAEFAAALIVFLLSHRVPAWLGLRAPLVARLGQAGYVAVFSALSLLLLAWVVIAAGRAPYVALWDLGVAARWIVNLTMPVAILLGVLGTFAPNPFAFEGRSTGFEPDHPGIVGLTRQPLLWALALWALAHLGANGDLAHAILFGLFAVFALIGMRALERRNRHAMGDDVWARLTRHTGLLPGAAWLTGRWRPVGKPPLARLALAVALWAGLWHLHAPVVGVWPGP